VQAVLRVSLVRISAAVKRTADCDRKRRCLISIPVQSDHSWASNCTGRERRSTPEKVVIAPARHCWREIVPQHLLILQDLFAPSSCRSETLHDLHNRRYSRQSSDGVRRRRIERRVISSTTWPGMSHYPQRTYQCTSLQSPSRKNPPEPRPNLCPARNIFTLFPSPSARLRPRRRRRPSLAWPHAFAHLSR
jgi:hypothetical protein